MRLKPNRRDTLMGASASLALAGCGATQDVPRQSDIPSAPTGLSDELARMDAVETVQRIKAGDFKAREVLEAALERLDAVEPDLNAVVTDTRDSASAALDAGVTGPFAGLPTFIKDLHDVAGQASQYGSRAFADNIAQSTDRLPGAWLDAGMVSLGKSSTPESGLMPTTEPALSGPTANPWNLEHVSGGSSGGAAALVAARVVPMAYASDGGGSIRIPAACCGVFGLKPSRGRTLEGASWSGDISESNCVSISVRDSESVLRLIAARSGDLPGLPSDMSPNGERLKIGFIADSFTGLPVDPEVAAAIQDTAALCEDLGHTVAPVELSIDSEAFTDAFLLLWAAGAAQFVQWGVGSQGAQLSLDDFEAWTLGLGQKFLSEQSRLPAAQAYISEAGRQYANDFDRHGMDVLLTPVLSKPATRIGELDPMLDYDTLLPRVLSFVGFTPIQNVAGAPAMSVPLHWSRAGLPIGSHFSSRVGDEASLFRLAYELEQARPWAGKRPPLIG